MPILNPTAPSAVQNITLRYYLRHPRQEISSIEYCQFFTNIRLINSISDSSLNVGELITTNIRKYRKKLVETPQIHTDYDISRKSLNLIVISPTHLETPPSFLCQRVGHLSGLVDAVLYGFGSEQGVLL